MSRTFVRRWLKRAAISLLGIGAFIGVAALFLYWFIGTAQFAAFIRPRIENILASGLHRKVEIRSFALQRGDPYHVIVRDIRIANAEGATTPWFATIAEVDVAARIESWTKRSIRIDRIDVRKPDINAEIHPQNFPSWKSESSDAVRVSIGKISIDGGAVHFVDRRDGVVADADDLHLRLLMQSQPEIYDAALVAPKITLRIKDGAPLDLKMTTVLRYSAGILALRSFDIGGSGITTSASGTLRVPEQTYTARLRGGAALDRLSAVLKLTPPTAGDIAINASVRGTGGKFDIGARWSAPRLATGGHEFKAVRGTMSITDAGAALKVDSATYAGGTLKGRYTLAKYEEPYPMSVALDFDRILVQQLLKSVNGAASGHLAYNWNGNRILEGGGEATATLAEAKAFVQEKHPLPVEVTADVVVNHGLVNIRRGSIKTPQSRAELGGTMQLSTQESDLTAAITSDDLAEIDRIAVNLGSPRLLGLGGKGDIAVTAKGRITSPVVTGRIGIDDSKYNGADLGRADLDVRYDVSTNALTVGESTFRTAQGHVAIRGDAAFTDGNFHGSIESDGYPLARLLNAAGLNARDVRSLTHGRIDVQGTTAKGRIKLTDFVLRRDTSEVKANGVVEWSDTTCLDLDVTARAFPLASIAPLIGAQGHLTGAITGSMRVSGSLREPTGGGAVTIEDAAVYGEPVNLATADITMVAGKIHATHVTVVAPAGSIEAAGDIDLPASRFSYDVRSTAIALARLEHLKNHDEQVNGNLTFESKGRGTFAEPDVTATATLDDAVIGGMTFPGGTLSPRVELTVHGRDVGIRGSAGDFLTIEGDTAISPDLAAAGTIRVAITDMAKMAAVVSPESPVPLSGHVAIDMKVGGAVSSLDALRVDATVNEFDVRLSDRSLTFARPVRFGLRDGAIAIDDFELQQEASAFVIEGSAQLTGDQRYDIKAHGNIDAALAELFASSVHAKGNIATEIAIGGKAGEPDIHGTIAIEHAQLRVADVPQTLEDINGTITLTRERLTIDQLSAKVGDGTMTVDGAVTLGGDKATTFTVGVKAKNVTVRTLEGLTVGGDGNIDLRGTTERMVVRGDINISKALYSKDLDIATAILNLVLSPKQSSAPRVAPGWKDRVSLDVSVVANNTLAIRNNIADISGKADLRLHGTLSRPSITGVVTLEEGGRVRIQNVDYQIVNGSINFQNPFRIDPYFDITLEGQVSSGGANDFDQSAGPVDVTINLSGTMDRFTPTISTNPPVSDVSLFSLLGFAGIDENNRAGTSSGGSVPVGFVTQSLVAHSMLNTLPFASSISYDPGLVDQVEDPGPKVTFQRQFQNNVRVIIIYNLERSHTRSRIEWHVTPEYSLQLTRDEVRQEYRLEARARRRYEAHWMWGSRDDEVALTAAYGPLTSASASPESASIVTEVSYRSDAPFDAEVLKGAVAVVAGKPLSKRAIQKSIRDLYATGEFSDVFVETAPSPTGIAVTFVFALNSRNARIDVEGLPKKQRDGAMREIHVRVDDVTSLAAIDASAVGMQRYLQSNGYFDAVVDPETTYQPARRLAATTFRVDAGPVATIGAVSVDGDFAPFKTDDLVAKIKAKPGKRFQRAVVREDANRIQQVMMKPDYRKASVRYAGETYDPKTHTVALRYIATAGPKVRVEVTGVSEKSVRNALKSTRNQPWTADIVEQTARAMAQIYEKRGHYHAEADARSAAEPDGTQVTTFDVRPGPKFRLDAVTFQGNARVTTETLEDAIAAKPQRGIRAWFGRMFKRDGVTHEQIAADRDAIEAYYQLQGFSEVDVRTPVVNADPAKGSVSIGYRIAEGPQTVVTSVRVEGNEKVPAASLPKLQVETGEPLNPQRLNKDVLALQTFYADRGHAEARVTVRPEISGDKTSAAVLYTIDEGSKTSVGRVIVRGNTYTDSDVVLQQSGIKPGAPFSYTSLLNAQRNLFRLGIFSRAEVQPETSTSGGEKKNVVVEVDEGKDLTLSGSFGVTQQSENGTSLLGTISAINSNLLGTGRSLGVTLVGSYPNNDREEFYITYREPFVGRYNVPVTFNVFKSEEVRPGAHITKNGTSVEVTKPLNRRTRWSVRYEYLNSLCTDGDLCAAGDEALIPGYDKDFSDELTSAITPTVYWDNRDDPIDPHRGIFTSVSLQYAFPLFAAHTNYTKEYGQISYYYPISRHTVFAVASRIGFIQGMGSTAQDDCDLSESCVPLTQRFTGGGESSHRSYALDLLGDLCNDPSHPECRPTLVDVEGTISPVGGKSVFISNLEYRFPIAGSVGAAIFTDFGNVFADNKIRLNHLHWGAGGGVRYLSPVGPLRFDVGYKIHRQSYESPYAYFLTFGYAF